MNEGFKRELTIEELEEQYKKISEQYNALGNQLKEKKQEAEDRKKAQLAAKKDARYKEIEEASEHLSQLIEDYTKDYGSFSFKRDYKDKYELPYLYHLFF